MTFHDNSVALWIRSPKIERHKAGDIVKALIPFYIFIAKNMDHNPLFVYIYDLKGTKQRIGLEYP